jgi:hypothetical protein
MKKGSCECIKGSLKGPCKHKASVAKEYKVKNFEILPEDNQEMRSFYHFLGTGNKKEVSWFRPIQEEASLPLVDWNNQDESQSSSGEEEASDLADDNMDIDDGRSDDEESNDDESDEEDENTLSNFKKSIFNLIYKIESRFDKDRGNYEKAINAFIKQSEKLSGDSAVQKALHLFAKDVVTAVKKGRKKNAGNIPVQNTARARRRIKHRGAGPSQQGRPTNEQSVRLQIFVDEEDDIVAHAIPNRKQKKAKHPHSLAAAVAANRAAEKKH